MAQIQHSQFLSNTTGDLTGANPYNRIRTNLAFTVLLIAS